MPREGQLISLQHRLLRAARAFIDPELQIGATTPEKASSCCMEDVVLSDAMATQEVERYTFRAPGQATSYFYGYSQLLELRAEVEKAQGAKFNAHAFHDFVLGAGPASAAPAAEGRDGGLRQVGVRPRSGTLGSDPAPTPLWHFGV